MCQAAREAARRLSHTFDDAAHCQRLAFLRLGKVVAQGTPAELKAATGNNNATLEDAFLFFIKHNEVKENVANTFTLANRVMIQIARDRRTIALIIVAPLIIATIAGFSITNKMMLNGAAPGILATLILFFGFLITGISFLRERTQGTLERLMVAPVSRMDIVAGYLLGLLLFALLQTLIMFFYMVYVLNISYRGQLWEILVFQVLMGIVAVSMGTFFSPSLATSSR